MTSSPSSTSNADTTAAPRADPSPGGTASVPNPPRFWSGNSPTSVRFPLPSSMMVNTHASLRMSSIPTTASSPFRSMPFTPCAVRPRTDRSDSGKRIALPALVISMTSPSPSERRTSIMRSPSFSPAAITPPARGFANSESLVRFMRPFFVRNTTKRSAVRSSAGNIATIASLRSAWVSA